MFNPIMIHLTLLLIFTSGSLALDYACEDYDHGCSKWANEKFCFTRTTYMMIVCRRSCGACGTARCENYNNKCEVLAKMGECNNSTKKYFMATQCRKACNSCGVETCRNYGDQCERLAKQGDCSKSKTNFYMATRCAKACELCVESCGQKPSTRIVGGTKAPKNTWPWQAMIVDSWGRQFCGGTLIHPLWVLSASHCFQPNVPGTVVKLGAHYKYGTIGTEQIIDVEKVIKHPNFHKPILRSHDIALIKLARPAMLNKAIGLACLPPEETSGIVPGKMCWITGWGRLSENMFDTTNVLMQTSVSIKSEADCKNAYPDKIHESMLCAGLDQGGKDACQGDSGGPLVCEQSGRFYLEGVTSWGFGCARPGLYGVYANVRILRRWILKTMRDN